MSTALNPRHDGPSRNRHRRKSALLLLALGAMAALVGPLAGGAGAEVSGGCTATMKGVDVGGRSSTKAADAIDVGAKEQLIAASTSAAPITGYKVQLEFGGFKWTVARGAASGNSWQRSVAVDDYASHGVGLYKVIGSSTGPGACTGAALVNVTGKSPLGTTAGLVGLALTGVGGLGLVASAIRAVPKAGSRRRVGLVALLMLPPLMMVGMGGSAPTPVRGVADEDRRGGPPRLSVLGLLSGVLGGLGVVVLLQQYAVVYPTRTVALMGVIGGVVVSLLATNLPPLLMRGKAGDSPAGVVAPVMEPAAEASDTILVDTDDVSAWAPTHTVPMSGLPAWPEPDSSAGVPADELDAGLEVTVLERTGTWAHIVCSNGWSAWVDGPQLVEMSQ